MKHFDWIRANKTNGKGWRTGYTQAAINKRTKDTNSRLSRFFHSLGERFDRKRS